MAISGFSRKVIGWSMQQTMTSDIVIKALLMAVWRRPKAKDVIVHSKQGSQYASGDYLDFLAAHNLIRSMSRRGHCLDNAVAESFFHSLKTERVKRKVYATRSEVKADLFDYIEVFTIELDYTAILVMYLQMNMRIHIHRQVKCLRNWGKLKS